MAGVDGNGALPYLRKGLLDQRGILPREEAPHLLGMAETGKPAYKGLGATSSSQHSSQLELNPIRYNGSHTHPNGSNAEYGQPEWMKLRIGGVHSENVIESNIPFYVAGMSFGSLKAQTKMALHLAANRLADQYGINLIISTGEGGALPWELFGREKHWNELSSAERDNHYDFTSRMMNFYRIHFNSQGEKQDFTERLFNREYPLIVQSASGGFFSALEYLINADAIEVKIGQGAKIGHGGLLPGGKVDEYVAAIRGIPEGRDARSPARILQILGPEDLVGYIQCLREATDWEIPIIVKIGASRVYYDTRIALKSLADAVAVDGLTGGTGAAPVKVQNVIGINTEPAIVEARRAITDYLSEARTHHEVEHNFKLLVSGGLPDYERVFKAIALGGDGVGIGTGFLQASGCTFVMNCNTNVCPVALTGFPSISRTDSDGKVYFRVDGEHRLLSEIIEINIGRIVNYVVATANRLKSMKSSRPTLDDLVTIDPFVSAFTGLPLLGEGISYAQKVERAADDLVSRLRQYNNKGQ